jgi:hypothetical protein
MNHFLLALAVTAGFLVLFFAWEFVWRKLWPGLSPGMGNWYFNRMYFPYVENGPDPPWGLRLVYWCAPYAIGLLGILYGIQHKAAPFPILTGIGIIFVFYLMRDWIPS